MPVVITTTGSHVRVPLHEARIVQRLKEEAKDCQELNGAIGDLDSEASWHRVVCSLDGACRVYSEQHSLRAASQGWPVAGILIHDVLPGLHGELVSQGLETAHHVVAECREWLTLWHRQDDAEGRVEVCWDPRIPAAAEEAPYA